MENKSTKLFINKTTNTQDAYMKFLKFHSKTFSFSYILYTVFWSFLFTLCIFLAFRGNARIQGVLLTIALIGFIAYRFFKPRMIMDNELKSEKVSTKSVNTYTFYERSFQIKNKNGTFNYKYFMINKVFETSEYGKIVIEDIKITDTEIKYTYYKDGVVPGYLTLWFYDEEGDEIDISSSIKESLDRHTGRYTTILKLEGYENDISKIRKIKKVSTFSHSDMKLLCNQQIKIDLKE